MTRSVQGMMMKIDNMLIEIRLYLSLWASDVLDVSTEVTCWKSSTLAEVLGLQSGLWRPKGREEHEEFGKVYNDALSRPLASPSASWSLSLKDVTTLSLISSSNSLSCDSVGTTTLTVALSQFLRKDWKDSMEWLTAEYFSMVFGGPFLPTNGSWPRRSIWTPNRVVI